MHHRPEHAASRIPSAESPIGLRARCSRFAQSPLRSASALKRGLGVVGITRTLRLPIVSLSTGRTEYERIPVPLTDLKLGLERAVPSDEATRPAVASSLAFVGDASELTLTAILAALALGYSWGWCLWG